MPRLPPLLVALLLLLPVGASASLLERPAGQWGNSADPEPNHAQDTRTHMWTSAPTDQVPRIYFDAVLLTPGIGATGTPLTGAPSTLAQVYAYFGAWVDCNGDGFIGYGALSLLQYPAELLASTVPCPPGDPHNRDGTVYEMLWVRPMGPAGPGEIVVPGVQAWVDLAGSYEPADREPLPVVDVGGTDEDDALVAEGTAALQAQPGKTAPDLVLSYQGSASDGVEPMYASPGGGALCASRCHGWVSKVFSITEPHVELSLGDLPYLVNGRLKQSASDAMTAYAHMTPEGWDMGLATPTDVENFYGAPQCGGYEESVQNGWNCDPDAWTGPVRLSQTYTLRDVDRLDLFDTAPAYRYDFDQDGDGIADDWAQAWEILDGASDIDLDNASALLEFRWSTYPAALLTSLDKARDYDRDGWLDGDEIAYWNAEPDPVVAAALKDAAAAGKTALKDPDDTDIPEEIEDNLTNVHDFDADGDGVADGAEYWDNGTYPEFTDSDCAPTATACTPVRETRYGAARVGSPGTGDLLSDREEILVWASVLGARGWAEHCDADGIPNILDPDSDGDGALDGEEEPKWLCDPDADDDGAWDGNETKVHHTDPQDPDSDDDGMPDGWEIDHRLLPLVDDAQADADMDDVQNDQEYLHGSDPQDRDSDNDGLDDGAERAAGTTLTDRDTDDDRMPDGWEVANQLDPRRDDAGDDADLDVGESEDGAIYRATNVEEYFYCISGWDESQGPNPHATSPLNVDTDGDGVADGMEILHGTSATLTCPSTNLPDVDEDGLLNEDELRHHTSLTRADTDDDGLCDGGRGLACYGNLGNAGPGEVNDFASSPFLRDTDDDGIDDWRESQYYDDDLAGATRPDSDGDGAIDIRDPDADDDGLLDGDESSFGTSWQLADSDADGLTDYEEIRVYADMRLDPLALDTDGDGLTDGVEMNQHGTDPSVPDTDDDGASDLAETSGGTSPFLPDTDRDGMPDGWELDHQLDPRDPLDAGLDDDRDGILGNLSNLAEYGYGTDPHLADTDGDRLFDGWEVLVGLDPRADDAADDTDGDGLRNLAESLFQTDPRRVDTDGDGATDGEEVAPALAQDLALELDIPWTSPNATDTDGDGLDDHRERALWGDGWLSDPDGDGGPLPRLAHNLRDRDSDNDGLDDGQEMLVFLTDPADDDTDDDGASDLDEVLLHATDPLDPASAPGVAREPTSDADGDGLGDADERALGTNADLADTDGDGLADGPERIAWGIDLLVDIDGDGSANNLRDPDADGDGVDDGTEFGHAALPRELHYVTSPRQADSDLDELSDGIEVRNRRVAAPVTDRAPEPRWTLPSFGGDEPQVGAWHVRLDAPMSEPVAEPGERRSRGNPSSIDTDGDGLPDGREFNVWMTSEASIDSEGDGILDPREKPRDTDRDGLVDGVDPDSDNDRIDDNVEDANGNGRVDGSETSPRDADTDDDGLCDDEERDGTTRTDARNADSDDDGLSDGLESARAEPCKYGGTESRALGITGRQTWQPFHGTSAPRPNALAKFPVEIHDWDGDGLIDGLEDLNTDGVLGEDETDPFLADTDEDGLPDSAERLVWGRMTFEQFVLRRGVIAYNALDPRKTNPRDADSDDDRIPDGYDINPAGLSPSFLQVKLRGFSMLDRIDFEFDRAHDWLPGYSVWSPEPYFVIDVYSATLEFHVNTVNGPEIPLDGPADEYDLGKLDFLGLTTPSAAVTSIASGAFDITLPENVTSFASGSRHGRVYEWDEIEIVIMLGDADCDLGGTSCRDESDRIDLDGRSPTGQALSFSRRLTEMAWSLTGAAPERPVLSDGNTDGAPERDVDSNPDIDDDGRIALDVSTPIYQVALNNARAVSSGLPWIPPTGQSWG